eukprot:599729-Amphidinium_carterae.1
MAPPGLQAEKGRTSSDTLGNAQGQRGAGAHGASSPARVHVFLPSSACKPLCNAEENPTLFPNHQQSTEVFDNKTNHQSLGVHVDGTLGVWCCPHSVLVQTWQLVLAVIEGEPCTKHDLQVVLGRLVRVPAIRRPLMCFLSFAWKVLVSVGLAAARSLRDANLGGGAVVRSSTLPPSGITRLTRLRVMLDQFRVPVRGHFLWIPTPEGRRCVRFCFPDVQFLGTCTLDACAAAVLSCHCSL